jgi:hypothetical protein
MDHGPAVEKLEGVREIETSLRQDFLALFLIPLEFRCGNLMCVITICNHTCIHAVLGAPPASRQADDAGSTESNHALGRVAFGLRRLKANGRRRQSLAEKQKEGVTLPMTSPAFRIGQSTRGSVPGPFRQRESARTIFSADAA